ncbi:MAG TPA: hypothetical protein VKT78_07935, partial [Fimbriimonadaceae bacterium]|nr:hypothetical protein [Fimbriimonadaceae bacterium]
IAYDTGAICSMNAASFVLALANRVGIDRRSALIQVHPSTRWKYYAIASARMRVQRGPYAVEGARRVDVAIDCTLSSTVLSYADANRPDPSAPDGTRFEKVGLRPVLFSWLATLELDPDGSIIGGRWDGGLENGPNQLVFPDGEPELTPHGFAVDNPFLQFAVIRQLAELSSSPADAPPRLDLHDLCAKVPCSPPRPLP